uniref:Uncharacterized protein n=1 Tax=Aegilops tauschii subsp. strangulata TaxID=200361 RepID=A0A453EP25_AEGTS
MPSSVPPTMTNEARPRNRHVSGTYLKKEALNMISKKKL